MKHFSNLHASLCISRVVVNKRFILSRLLYKESPPSYPERRKTRRKKMREEREKKEREREKKKRRKKKTKDLSAGKFGYELTMRFLHGNLEPTGKKKKKKMKNVCFQFETKEKEKEEKERKRELLQS